MIKKLFIKTFGCQMNEYDSSRIADLFISSGDFEITQNPKNADIILLNTCSIRKKAEEKVFSDLGRFRLLKQKNLNLIIGVGGCVASQEGEMIFKRAPYVDIVFGPQTLHRLFDMYKKVKQQNTKISDISYPKIEKFGCLPKTTTNNPSAYVTIMEGCNNFCSYCIVPYTRNREISRPIQDILNEIITLTEKGAKEITLLGQNVNNYKDPVTESDLATLIHHVSKIKEIERIRFMTSNPFNFPDELINTYRDIPKLAAHLHLPIQSGSDRILKEMRRKHTIKDYEIIIQKLKKANLNISISTDFIVGFPTETDKDFNDTINLVRNIGFDHSFSFIYSPRPNTPAAKMHDDVPLKIKKERLMILQNELIKSERQINKNMIETNQKILVTGKSKRNLNELMGKTENNRTINFEGNDNLIGQFVTVKIKEALLNSLKGIIV